MKLGQPLKWTRIGLVVLAAATFAAAPAQGLNLRLLGSNATVNLRETTPRGSTTVTGFDAKNNTVLGIETSVSATGQGTWDQSGRSSQTVTATPSGFQAVSGVRLDQTYLKGKNTSNGIASARGSVEFTLTKTGDFGLTLRATQTQSGVPAGGIFPALDSYATLFRADDPSGTPLLQFDLTDTGELKKSGAVHLQPGTYSVLFGSAVSREWTDLTSPSRKTPYSGQIDSTLSLNAVPEPPPLGLLGAGGLLIFAKRRK